VAPFGVEVTKSADQFRWKWRPQLDSGGVSYRGGQSEHQSASALIA
jgi:hypothetical protein